MNKFFTSNFNLFLTFSPVPKLALSDIFASLLRHLPSSVAPFCLVAQSACPQLPTNPDREYMCGSSGYTSLVSNRQMTHCLPRQALQLPLAGQGGAGNYLGAFENRRALRNA